MSESMSGFFLPEESEAAQTQQQSRTRDATPSEVEIAILQALNTHGPMSVGDLLNQIAARPREVIARLSELEDRQLVKISTADADEVVELTPQGRASATPDD